MAQEVLGASHDKDVWVTLALAIPLGCLSIGYPISQTHNQTGGLP